MSTNQSEINTYIADYSTKIYLDNKLSEIGKCGNECLTNFNEKTLSLKEKECFRKCLNNVFENKFIQTLK